MQKLLLTIILSLYFQFCFSQVLSNLVIKEIVVENDTLQVDSMSIIPGTLQLEDGNMLIAKDSYLVDYGRAYLYIRDSLLIHQKRRLRLSYRRFNQNFYSPYFHKVIDTLWQSEKNYKTYIYQPEESEERFFSSSQIETSGSLSRGIVVGNNQDLSLNSDLNLQISGNISPDIRIRGILSDDNLPVQASGTSQHLREFNKVFIELYTQDSKLTAGDYEITGTKSFFSKYKKNVKGLGFENEIDFKRTKMNSKYFATLSKGMFNKLKIQGIEANQGPYKLTGANNESFIVVLSGSERIYIDGKLLKRGVENDYVIDYNTAEITFTINRIITKDSRIIAEFEYTEQSYARFTFGTEQIFKREKSFIFLNYYSENDAKNSSLRQELSDEEKIILNTAGDDLSMVLVPNVRENDGQLKSDVLYKRTDTVVSGILYNDIYEQTNDRTGTTYVVGFSYVGENQGNYIRVQSSLNGKVYKWVSPVEGIPQGDYEPVRQLIGPKRKQVLTIGGNIDASSRLKFNYELSVSENDKNLFSKLEDKDNVGFAYKVGIDRLFFSIDTGKRSLRIGLDYRSVRKQYNTIEPFKETEFERNWNIINPTLGLNEHSVSLRANYKENEAFRIFYNSNFLIFSDIYRGFKNGFDAFYEWGGYYISTNFNILSSNDSIFNSLYFTYRTTVKKRVKFFEFGIENSGERNLIRYTDTAEISPLSYRFNEINTYIALPGEGKLSMRISYINREDFKPMQDRFNLGSHSDGYQFSGMWNPIKAIRLKTNLSYRNLRIQQNQDSTIESGPSSGGNLEYSINILKGAISHSSFLEHITGNEFYSDYTYFEVKPGQGYYTWIDINSNGQKELNEFVKAVFSDEALFIRIMLPSDQIRRVYNQSFSQSLNIVPRRIWQNEKGVKKMATYLTDQFSMRINRKIGETYDFLGLSLPDSNMLIKNGFIKNHLVFEIPKTNLKFGYIYSQNFSNHLLVNGIDKRKSRKHEISCNIIGKKFGFSNNFFRGFNHYESEFFPEIGFLIDNLGNTLAIIAKPVLRNEIKADFSIIKKKNLEGEEESFSYHAGIEFKYQAGQEGNILLKFNYIDIHYTGNINSTVSYEMNEGLSPGKNYLWSVLWFRKLNDFLQLEFQYSGRKTGEKKIIHTGSVNVRALF